MWKILAIFLISASPAFALEAGDVCSPFVKLPAHFSCSEKVVYDCRELDGRMGRMGYVVCGDRRLKLLEREMMQRYKRLLKSYESQPEGGEDFNLARASLVKSQKAWRQLVRADCDLSDSLLGTGNASAGVAIDCQIGHFRERNARLKSLGG